MATKTIAPSKALIKWAKGHDGHRVTGTAMGRFACVDCNTYSPSISASVGWSDSIAVDLEALASAANVKFPNWGVQ